MKVPATIDSGAEVNLLSEDLMKKLKMRMYPVEQPWKIMTFDNHTEYTVRRKAMLKISFGGITRQ